MPTINTAKTHPLTSAFKNNLKNHPVITVTFLLISIIFVALIITRTTAIASRSNDILTQQDISKAIKISALSINEVDQYTVKQNISGQIIAARESDHGFDRSGVIAEILVDEGDNVKKGDILARLDMRKINAKENELKADLDGAIAIKSEAAANLVRAQAAFDRYDILKNNGHVSQHKFDEIKFDLKSIEARLSAAISSIDKVKAVLASLQTERDLSTLKAYFNGNIVTRYLDEGSSFGVGGSPVIRLIENDKLEIHMGLPEKTAADMEIGKHYQFKQMGKNIDSKLRAMVSKIDLNTRTVTAIFDVEINQNIRVGSIVQLPVNIIIQEKGFWLPTGALGESRRGLWSAYSLAAVDGHNHISRLKRQEIQVIYTQADKVFVRGTLKDGDMVVASGIHRLAPGFLVRTQ